MEQVEFNSTDEATEYVADFLRNRLPETSLPPDLPSLVAQNLLPMWAKPAETVQPVRGRPAHVTRFRWVIRNEDLKLLDSVLDGLKASAAVGFFLIPAVSAAAALAAAAGIFAGLLKLAYNVVIKGAILSARNYSIIAALFNRPDGLTDQEILDQLIVAEPKLVWTIEDVREGLTMLSEIPSRSGKISLVWKSTDGRWRTTGV